MAVSHVVWPDAHAEDLSAEGFEQNVLHAEGRGAEAHGNQQALGAAREA
jgi:hypothetical protein